ncbi:MAG: hypothetical protein IPK04_15815 [Bdellovibrionales bacterium]|nr:hypothetical protein [Bdellovibrionales bacterium]
MALRELLDAKNSRLGLFTDPIQNIQNQQDNSGAAFDGRPARILLRYNIRNTKQICSYASPYYCEAAKKAHLELRPLISPADFPNGKTPEIFKASDEKAASDRLSTLLHDLVVIEKIPLSRVTVLSSLSHRDILKEGKAGLRQGRALGPYNLGAQFEASTKTVQLETIRRFKGRENLVIIALEYGEIEEKLRYVTYSRALARLYVIRIGIAPLKK